MDQYLDNFIEQIPGTSLEEKQVLSDNFFLSVCYQTSKKYFSHAFLVFLVGKVSWIPRSTTSQHAQQSCQHEDKFFNYFCVHFVLAPAIVNIDSYIKKDVLNVLGKVTQIAPVELGSDAKVAFSYGYSFNVSLLILFLALWIGRTWSTMRELFRQWSLTTPVPGAYQVFSFMHLYCLVVEIDIPYKDSQSTEYGEHFNSWCEDDFSKFLGSLIAAIPLSALTLVVSIFLWILSLQVHHGESQAPFVRRWLTTSSFKPVIPMFMVKYGNLFTLVLIFQIDAFTTLNMMACPAVETFTLATKIPKGRSIH